MASAPIPHYRCSGASSLRFIDAGIRQHLTVDPPLRRCWIAKTLPRHHNCLLAKSLLRLIRLVTYRWTYSSIGVLGLSGTLRFIFTRLSPLNGIILAIINCGASNFGPLRCCGNPVGVTVIRMLGLSGILKFIITRQSIRCGNILAIMDCEAKLSPNFGP